jgi:enoyl-CoA hydratase/carnithine racemase
MHVIRMQHPAKNALGSDLMGWLETEMERAGAEPILLTGSGDSFSAGLDLKEVASLDGAGMERFLRRLDAIAVRLFLHPAPVVACVNGHAIAGGCVLATCCDWRIAQRHPKTRIGTNEVAIGACFPPAILKIMVHRLPARVRERVLLGAGLVDVEGALALGLVDEASDDAEAAATKRLEALSAHPRSTYALTKSALRSAVVARSAEDERRFREQEVPIWSSGEMKARVAAVLGKR